MSAFLGPIHYWLYHKVELQQQVVADLVKLSRSKEALKSKLDSDYGTLPEGPLELNIDGNNIHGWLQQQVSKVEYQLAACITALVQEDEGNHEKIKAIFRANGKEVSRGLNLKVQNVYQLIQDSLLDGMPCDHANELLVQDEGQVVWRRVTCVHEAYWKAVGGNSRTYYEMREAWLQGLLEGTSLHLEILDETTYCIKEGNTHE